MKTRTATARPARRTAQDAVLENAAVLMGLAEMLKARAQEAVSGAESAHWGDVGDVAHLVEKATEALVPGAYRADEDEADTVRRVHAEAVAIFETL